MSTRVFNLDSESLNKSLDNEISNQINDLLRQLDNKNIEKYNSELKLLVNLFIWYKTIYKDGSTIGHNVFGLKFNELSKLKSYLQLFCSIIYPFLDHKLESNQFNLDYFNQLKKIFKLFNFINFLLFLRTGNYLNIWYRLFKIDPKFTNTINFNQSTYEFMNRELVWSTAIDFLTFIIPIIDLNKSWTKLKSIFIDEKLFDLNEFNRTVKRNDNHFTKCNLCNDYPIDPHEIGCLHVYCYYCVMSQFELLNGLTCFKCRFRIDDRKFIKKINLRCLINNN